MNSLQVFFQSDGNMAASVRVPTPQDAQYAISQLHRKKVNFKQFFLHTYSCYKITENQIFCQN